MSVWKNREDFTNSCVAANGLDQQQFESAFPTRDFQIWQQRWNGIVLGGAGWYINNVFVAAQDVQPAQRLRFKAFVFFDLLASNGWTDTTMPAHVRRLIGICIKMQQHGIVELTRHITSYGDLITVGVPDGLVCACTQVASDLKAIRVINFPH